MNNYDVFSSRTTGVMRVFVTLVGLLWVGAFMSRADTHYVSLDGDNTSPYTNGWASAATQIQWAMDQAIA
ncbi:MAG: hypothetical protein KKD33_00480, partial [Verrucomicrobia bacterium]|nr:hypothetical protein [Verrucomicrobiota bacterium]